MAASVVGILGDEETAGLSITSNGHSVATTRAGFTITVTDTMTGNSVQYQNADLTVASPVQDTSALPCP
jgi:predicted RNA-binding protein with TRAM domain